MTATFILALTLTVMGSSLHALAQGDPFQELKKYDFQDRRASAAIRKLTQSAGQDKAKQAPIEIGLIGVIQDPASTVAGKQDAAKFLWQVGSTRSVPVLAKLLPDPELNNVARYGLERNPDPSAAAALRAALKVASGSPLVGIINSLGNRGDAASVPSLKVLAMSKEPLVSDAAITALGKIGTVSSLSVLEALPKSIGVYNGLLRTAAKLASAGGRPGSIQLYNQLTGSTNPAVIRAGALAGLASLHAPETAAVALTVAVTAPEPVLQRAAARIAGSQAGPRDTQRSLTAWTKLPAPAKASILAAWADRGERLAAATAVSATNSPDPAIQAAGIRAASRLAGAPVVPTLAALAMAGDQAGVARDALAHMHGPGVEAALIHLSEQGSSDLRITAVNILAQRPSPASTAALLGQARADEPRIASAALKGIAQTGTSDMETPLVQILVGAKDDSVRDSAQNAIVAIAQRSGNRSSSAEPLLSAMAGASTPAKASLLAALAELGGDRALDALSTASASTDGEVRGAALNSLANSWSDSRALPVLLGLAKNGASRSEKIVALRGYLRLVASDDRAPAETRIARIQEAMAVSERAEEKRQALSILRDVRTTDSVEMASRALDDPEIATEAADAILYLAAPQRKRNRELPAVKGSAVESALDKIIRTAKDDAQREKARSLRQG